MKKLRIEIHIMDSELELGRYHMSWDAVLREEFRRQGDNVWSSVGEYWAEYDKEAAKGLKTFAEERLKEHGLEDFYVEIEEYEDET